VSLTSTDCGFVTLLAPSDEQLKYSDENIINRPELPRHGMHGELRRRNEPMKKILVIEDEPEMRRNLTTVLRLEDFQPLSPKMVVSG